MAKETGIVPWKDLALGCTLTEPGTAAQLRTGDWRAMRPVINYELCSKCGQCYIFCPDMVYSRTAEGYYEANYYYCKGCGICARECPKNAIQMVQEEK